MTGISYPEWAGQIHFWTSFIGVNILFFPQHFLGLAGMPRRYIDYPDIYAGWNMVSSWGAYLAMASTVFFFIVTFFVFFFGSKAKANPWGEGATTLEWQVPSPAPFHTFETPPDFNKDNISSQPAE